MADEPVPLPDYKATRPSDDQVQREARESGNDPAGYRELGMAEYLWANISALSEGVIKYLPINGPEVARSSSHPLSHAFATNNRDDELCKYLPSTGAPRSH